MKVPRFSRYKCVLLLLTLGLAAAACSDDVENNKPPAQDTGDVGDDADAGADTDPGDDAGPDADAGPDDDADVTEPPEPIDPVQGRWSTDFTSPGMMGDSGARVYKLLRGSDGSIYAGGIFEVAGKADARGIARWSDGKWEAIGDSLDMEVEAIVEAPDGTIYAGGVSTGGGGGIGIGIGSPNYLMKWDGESWSEVAQFESDFRSIIKDLEWLPGNRLLVAGSFDTIDGEAYANIAIYDGQSWSRPGDASPSASVNAIAMTGEETFCAAGDFTTIGALEANFVACWNGTGWEARGEGLWGEVNDLIHAGDGRLIAGGTFAYTTNWDTGEYLAGLAEWNGTEWSILAGGVEGGFINDVRALALGPSGELYVGGTFQQVGKNLQNLSASHIARLDGDTWSRLDTGVRNDVGMVLGSVVGVNDILVQPDGSLIVGGLFSEAGPNFALNIARWQNDAWWPMVEQGKRFLGIGGVINSVVKDSEGVIYAGGYFAHAGTTTAINVARLVGGEWQEVGSGLNDVVFALAVDDQDRVIAAGDFMSVGPSQASFIARWNGTAWEKLGAGVDGRVMSLLVGPDGAIYAGGDFTVAGSVAVDGIAKFNGQDWENLGEGLGGRVSTMAFGPDGALYAGGIFTHTGDEREVNYLARWSGERWEPVGGGLSGRVSQLGIYDGKLLVAGSFEKAGDVVVNAIALWDGAVWTSVGGGIPSGHEGLPSTTISGVNIQANGIFVTGTFREGHGGVELNHLTWWDGTEWHPLGGGLSDLGESLLVHDDSLWVGGTFTRAGGRPSYGMARWLFDGAED